MDERQTRQRPTRAPFGRIQNALGAAILSISGAGLVHKTMGLDWGMPQQIFYAALGGLLCWRLMR